MQVLKTLLIVLIIVFSASFIVKNDWIIREEKYIEYYGGYKSTAIPLFVLFLANILLGALLIGVPSFLKIQRLKKLVKMERKKITQMEKELNSLRNLPITEEKDIEQINQES